MADTDTSTKLGQVVQAINGLATAIGKLFVGASSISSTATAGTAGAPPAQVASYIVVTLPNGTTGKVPVYNP